MPRTLSVGFLLAKNRLDPQSPWAELYQIDVVTFTLRMTSWSKPFIYEGLKYETYPIRHEEMAVEGRGKLPKLTVHVSNVATEVQYYLETYRGLRGRKATIILVNTKDTTIGDLRSTFAIENATSAGEVTSFVLAKPIPLFEVKLPRRLITRVTVPGLKVQ